MKKLEIVILIALIGFGICAKAQYEKEYVEIGGVKWATKNISSTPKIFVSNMLDKGGYYRQADAQEACPSGWRLPYEHEFKRLMNESSKWTGEGVVKGTNWDAIYLPAAGHRTFDNKGAIKDVGKCGIYWSYELASAIGDAGYTESGIAFAFLADGKGHIGTFKLWNEYSVRCVKE